MPWATAWTVAKVEQGEVFEAVAEPQTRDHPAGVRIGSGGAVAVEIRLHVELLGELGGKLRSSGELIEDLREDFINGDPTLFRILLELMATNVTEDDVVDERAGGGLAALGEP